MNEVTAEIAAKAVVAACRQLGGDPTRVFAGERGNHRIRALAAAGAARALGLTNKVAARAFQTLPTRLAPTQLVRHRIGAEQVQAVAEALGAASAPPAPPNPPNPVRPRPAPVRAAEIETLKPVNENIVRWSRIFVARGMAVAELADLFGVDAEDLAEHLKPELARAA